MGGRCGVRLMVVKECTAISLDLVYLYFSLAGIVDSIDTISFTIELWNDTFEKVMMAVVLAYFGGRTTEKASSIIKKK